MPHRTQPSRPTSRPTGCRTCPASRNLSEALGTAPESGQNPFDQPFAEASQALAQQAQNLENFFNEGLAQSPSQTAALQQAEATPVSLPRQHPRHKLPPPSPSATSPLPRPAPLPLPHLPTPPLHLSPTPKPPRPLAQTLDAVDQAVAEAQAAAASAEAAAHGEAAAGTLQGRLRNPASFRMPPLPKQPEPRRPRHPQPARQPLVPLHLAPRQPPLRDNFPGAPAPGALAPGAPSPGSPSQSLAKQRKPLPKQPPPKQLP